MNEMMKQNEFQIQNAHTSTEAAREWEKKAIENRNMFSMKNRWICLTLMWPSLFYKLLVRVYVYHAIVYSLTNFTSFGYFYGHRIQALVAKSVATPLSSFSSELRVCVRDFRQTNLHFRYKV